MIGLHVLLPAEYAIGRNFAIIAKEQIKRINNVTLLKNVTASTTILEQVIMQHTKPGQMSEAIKLVISS